MDKNICIPLIETIYNHKYVLTITGIIIFSNINHHFEKYIADFHKV